MRSQFLKTLPLLVAMYVAIGGFAIPAVYGQNRTTSIETETRYRIVYRFSPTEKYREAFKEGSPAKTVPEAKKIALGLQQSFRQRGLRGYEIEVRELKSFPRIVGKLRPLRKLPDIPTLQPLRRVKTASR